MATTNGSTAIRDKILASLARYRALRIGKFPCAFWRLSSRPGLTAYVSFANCGLPYFIGDVIVGEEKLLVATPALFENRFNIRVCTDTQVLSIDKENQKITVLDLASKAERVENYDALVLSTGSQSVCRILMDLIYRVYMS